MTTQQNVQPREEVLSLGRNTQDTCLQGSHMLHGHFPDSTRRGDVEAGNQQSDSSSTSFYTF